MSFDTDRIKRAMTSKAGKKTAGAVGGISLGALVALAGPEYFKLREASANVSVLQAKVDKLESGNKTKWDAIKENRDRLELVDKRLLVIETRLQERRTQQ